jgi:hypothetical protein
MGKLSSLILVAGILMVGNVRAAGLSTSLSFDKGLSVGGIAVEQSQFLDVTKTFGKTMLIKIGDAATAETYACYLSRDRNEALYFTSSEMGGGTTVNGIDIKTATVQSLKDCQPTSLPMSFKNGLKLGTAFEQAIAILGQPKIQGLGIIGYSFKKNIPQN